MAAKFAVILNGERVFEAGSPSALVRILEREADNWATVVPGLAMRHPHTNFAFQANYQSLIKEVLSVDPKSSAVFDLSGKPGAQVFPPFGSREGKILRSLMHQLPLAVGIMIAFMVDNRWESEDRFYQQNHLGMDAMAGRTLLALARATTLPLEKERGDLEQAAAQLQGDLVDLEARAAAFGAKMDADELRVAEVVSSFSERTNQLKALYCTLLRRYIRRSNQRDRKFKQSFAATHEAYVAKLQFEAPATLWSVSSAQHYVKARDAFWVFVALMIAIVVLTLSVATKYGTMVAELFKKGQCPESARDCASYLSPEGPLVLGAVLLALSMSIWGLRMANRIHLSERNLAQAAAEKKAFVETYLALIKDGKVTREQEAIVLGAIFRPSSDGYVSDDSSSVDISAAAVLAKVMSGKS